MIATITLTLKGLEVKKTLILAVLAGLCTAMAISGCAAVSYSGSKASNYALRKTHQTPQESEKLNVSYYLTVLGETSSADVLESIQNTESEIVSQSQTVIASYGWDEKPEKAWSNMVAFDEEALTASRKYFLKSCDTPTKWFVLKEKFRFDAEVLLSDAILDEAYANSNDRRIAALEAVRKSYYGDLMQLQNYNTKLINIGLLVNQTLNVVINNFKVNPDFAVTLENAEGMDFDHPTLGEGKIKMMIDDATGTVRLKVKIGTVIDTWLEQEDVKLMFDM